jgi:CDP-diacylglycerol--serine O-phosphatidyltransferase
MTRRPIFIISLNWVDWLTLGSLLLSSLGLLSAFQNDLALSIAFMLVAMFVDLLDGLLARRFGLEDEFGRYLDSFCDVFTYLLLPLFILYQFGMHDLLSIAALFVFLVSGLLRLSRFNIIGTVEQGGRQYHLGLQVVWSQLVVVLAFPAWHRLGIITHYLLILILPAMSILMICNIHFRKPTQYAFLTVLILSVAVVYAFLHFFGIRTP